ncbi:MAG: LacI family DNA-binding transcriptional regulator, partial [Eubacteriales bacterium]|nr:LacI family DNA-binding transcriptional regulator [Eubacteriales bacterium]
AKAGVSISMVSFVLNDTPGRSVAAETRENILDAVKELGYRPDSIASGMRTRRSMSIGIVSFWNISSSVFNEIFYGVSLTAAREGYTILFCNLGRAVNGPAHDGQDYADLYKRRKIDGIILISPHSVQTGFSEDEHISVIRSLKIPAVIINAYTHAPDISYVYTDFYDSVYMAAEYLYKTGHRAIWYMKPSPAELEDYQGRERLRAYREFAHKHCLKTNEFDESGIDNVINSVRKGAGLSGIVANKCAGAQILMKRFLTAGIRIPGEISLIAGNDETYAAQLIPSLSTVKLPLRMMGEKGAEMLMKQMRGAAGAEKITLKNRIMARESTRPF